MGKPLQSLRTLIYQPLRGGSGSKYLGETRAAVNLNPDRPGDAAPALHCCSTAQVLHISTRHIQRTAAVYRQTFLHQ